MVSRGVLHFVLQGFDVEKETSDGYIQIKIRYRALKVNKYECEDEN